jgi:hypothetical protein
MSSRVPAGSPSVRLPEGAGMAALRARPVNSAGAAPVAQWIERPPPKR